MSFESFLTTFIPQVQKKAKQVNLAHWILETTGSEDAAILKAELEIEYRLLFNDKSVFDKLVEWNLDPHLSDPLLKRQLNVLIRMFKPNLIEKKLLEAITKEEAHLSFLYSNFRPKIQGKEVSDNEIREILKTENNPDLRKEAWEASKEIGKALSPTILKLVKLRNEAARSLGFDNYFSMQLELQEVDEKWLFTTLDRFNKDSDAAYTQVLHEIHQYAANRFHVPIEEIGPWAWSEPFSQEDPVNAKSLDQLTDGIDLIQSSQDFYHKMDLDVEAILKRSDHYERPGKNQHAFCISIDRDQDVRTLNNVRATSKWLETVLHELGHAVYEIGFDPTLPWLLKEPPHMITTEAMALLAGRQAYRPKSLTFLNPNSSIQLHKEAEISMKRRQLIFSRWVLVMTYFERELYANPEQNLNKLWWETIEKFQKIRCAGSRSQADWAAKYHIGLAPVYYFSYLLGELFASMLEEKIDLFPSPKTGAFLKEKLFKPGNSLHWNALIKHATGEELHSQAWVNQFAF